MPVADPTDIPVWRRLNMCLTTSGQPSEAQLSSLRDIGVANIINLGLHSHERALPDEAASVAALGMNYIHIPVAFDRPSESDFQDFVRALSETGHQKTHVHCIVNARVSAFFYRYQRDVLALPEREARALMDSVWRPGGVWAAFIGDEARVGEPHGPAAS